jgi:hypothetical protein
MASMYEQNDVDKLGLPVSILGNHPDEFYGVIGRIVCVCAVLEEKVTTLRHTLANAQQGKFTHEPVGAQIAAARRLTRDLPHGTEQDVIAFLDEAEVAFRHRNALVHSSFPAQPDGRIWGHRATRDKAVTDGTADTVETTLEELRMFLRKLAELVRSFIQVHALASVRGHSRG